MAVVNPEISSSDFGGMFPRERASVKAGGWTAGLGTGKDGFEISVQP